VQQVEELFQAHRKTMIDSVATALGCSHGLAYSIMHGHLKFWKVCIRWVPRELKNQEKMNRIVLSLQHLLWYANEGKICLTGFLLGTNHGCVNTNLNQSMLQCNRSIPVHLQPKSLRLCHQLGSLCLPCFGILREYC
jgi:hypothetical protein